MAKVERYRESVTTPPTAEEVAARQREGWRLVGVEWQRGEEHGADVRPWRPELPYGLRAGSHGLELEEDPAEMETLRVMLELIIDDETSLLQVAAELNRRGCLTRRGHRWNPIAVFNLLPRLVEVAPRIYASERWTGGPQRAVQA